MVQQAFWHEQRIIKKEIETVQINLGTRCNQVCAHCHVEGSPDGSSMHQETAGRIIAKAAQLPVRHIELTGGAPEINPCLRLFIQRLATDRRQLTVRTNLTILALPEYSFYPELYRQYNVALVASLPCYTPENVNQQRGNGVFEKSIAVLQRLNSIGYGANGLRLDLAYNPLGDFLPPDCPPLERRYRQLLQERYGILFNNLLTMTNSPTGRFKKYLVAENKLHAYLALLRRHYNPATLGSIMCTQLLSIDYQGYLYDCDFNLALDKKIKGYEHSKFWDVDFSRFASDITFDDHCYACTAGAGSSCHGALVGCDRITETHEHTA